MFKISDLKPKSKPLVMDLLDQAGMDVSHWCENFKGKSPAANPNYCYNWSFEQPGEFIVACLWYDNLSPHKGTAAYRLRPRSRRSRRKEPGANVWNRRADDFNKHLRLAYEEQLPVIAIIGDGTQRNPADTKPRASSVKARLLDTVPWAITEYSPSTGECTVVRGAKPIIPAIASSDLVLSWFEGTRKQAFVFHRRREGKARRAKIKEALQNSRLICEVTNCGFDFERRYGKLGAGYAEVHHLEPLSKAPKEGRPIMLDQLAIVCSNCHVMIHLGGECRPLKGLIQP
jgi:5-methylcytosine-specific restriction protein A